MDDHRDPRSNAPDEGELLAAYLAAETDEVTTARIERLLREDPRVAARLDALARARERMQRLDEVSPPAGYRDRLTARLRDERAARTTPAERTARSADGGPAAHQVQPAAGDGRDRRRAAPPAWVRRLSPAAAAAALVLVAVVGGSMLFRAGSAEDTAGTAEIQADAPADGAVPAEPFSAEEAAGVDADDERAQAGEAGAAAPPAAADDDIVSRLRGVVPRTDDPRAREADLRAQAGLPLDPLCLEEIDPVAIDLVERDGRLQLTALIEPDGAARVEVFDPLTCERVRTFSP